MLGIGNIYVDEVLWWVKVNGVYVVVILRCWCLGVVLYVVVDVMCEVLVKGGILFDFLYVNVNGELGYFEWLLDVYGCEGENCWCCGVVICWERFMNCLLFYCL